MMEFAKGCNTIAKDKNEKNFLSDEEMIQLKSLCRKWLDGFWEMQDEEIRRTIKEVDEL